MSLLISYSTIWLARALPEGGKLITLELSEKHAAVSKLKDSRFFFCPTKVTSVSWQVAKENISNAGLSGKVEVITGKAIESLAAMHPDIPFDLIFIDADKPSNAHYFTEAKRLVRKGGVIVRLIS